jgi:hypothetical protein
MQAKALLLSHAANARGRGDSPDISPNLLLGRRRFLLVARCAGVCSSSPHPPGDPVFYAVAKIDPGIWDKGRPSDLVRRSGLKLQSYQKCPQRGVVLGIQNAGDGSSILEALTSH